MKKEEFITLLDGEIEKNWSMIVSMSDDFAANPEISGEEFVTSKKIVEVLQTAGFHVEYPFMGIPTAFMAKKGIRGNGAKVALMVEYDALPEIGHACGHNLHGSMSVLAGIGLLPLMETIGGELVIVGTPSEETSGAKVVMAANGFFDDCDLAMMIHCSGGRTIVKYRALALDAIEFTFKGQSSHAAAAPWEGRNALNGLLLLFHAIDMYRQHVKPEARMHGIVYNGGTAPNIVPETAVGRFYFRAPKRSYLDGMIEQILNCARGTALATNTEVTWRNFEASFMDILPNPTAEQMVENIFSTFNMPVVELEGFLGSSDVGDVSYHCPALEIAMDFTGFPLSQHTRPFAEATLTPRGHEALMTGAKILGRASINVFLDQELCKQMRNDFKEELKK